MRIRNVLIALFAILVLLVVVGFALLGNVDRFRPKVQAELQQKLNRPVTLGHLGLKLLPFSVRIDDVTIGDAPGSSSNRPFATAKEVYVSAGLLSILRGNPEVNDLTLDHPQIELVRNASGVWNFSTIGRSGPATPAPSTPAANDGSGSNSQFSLSKLTIDDGQVAITDIAARQARSVYDHVDLNLSGLAPGKKVGIEANLHLPGAGKELLSFKGDAGPIDPAHSADTPVTGKLSLDGVTLAGFSNFAHGAIPPQTDATVTGDADVSTAAETLSAKGSLKLVDISVRGQKLAFPINTQFDVADNRTTDVLSVRSGTVQVGGTSFTLGGSVNTHATPTMVDVRAGTKNSSVTELAQLAGAFGAPFNPAHQIKGTVSADVTAKGSVSAPQMNIQFALNADSIDTADLENATSAPASAHAAQPTAATPASQATPAKPTPAASQSSLMNNLTGSGTIAIQSVKAQEFLLTNVHANAKIDRGVITLAPLTTNLFGGSENGTISLDIRPAHPQCSVNAKLAGIDTNALLSAVSTAKNTLYGSLSGDTNVSFTLLSSSDLPKTLNGTVAFNVANGQLKNINILDELSKIGKFLKAAPSSGAGGNATALKQLSGSLHIVNGVANTNDLKAALDAGSISAKGSANLVSQALDMQADAVLGSSVSQSVGGSGIGGLMQTALANKQGELVIPVHIAGTLSHPSFTPDVQSLAKMRLNNLLPTSGDPTKLTSGLLNGVKGGGGVGGIVGGVLGGAAGSKQQNGATQKPAQNPKDAVNSILNGFGKKKK